MRQPVVGVLSPPTNISDTSLTLNWTAATDNVGVTNYRVYIDGVLKQEIGNVLTYDVTGLSPDTTYSFYVTALDEEGNESNQSNIVNAKTIPIAISASITLTTNSNDEFWSPNIITNSGATLKWSVSGGGVEIDEIVDNAPVLNLLNNNSETTITITSDQGFIGFTEFDTNDQGITSINFSQATELEFLRLRYEQLTSISVAENTALKVLNLKGNDLLNGIIDVSNNPNLEILVVEDSGISEVSLVNNPLLFEVFANNADFSSNSLNQILLDLDAHPSYNPPGTFRIALRNQTNGQEITEAALEAYNSLIAKGWTIDVDPPTTDSNNNTQSITLTTNSNDEFWSPNIITNSGATLKWSVSGGGVEIDEIVDNAPVLNLLNNNSETTITITSDQGFIGFTEFDTNDQGITSINFSQATELEFLRLRYEQLTSISVAENTALKVLNLKGNDLLNGIIDVSNNPNLEILVVEDSGISEVSLVNNPLLFEVFANNADFSSNSLNQILLDLDAHPSYNPPGTFRIALRNQTNGQEITEAALEAYNSLIAKGWTIDVDPPTTDSNNNTQSITLTTNSNDEFWSPNIITNSGATLKWSVSGGGVEIDEIVDNAPVLNLLNNNSETTITITSDQGFIGFTEFDTNDQGITSINFSQATELEFLRLRYEQLTSISVAENTALKVLNLKGNDLLNGIIDVSNNPNLEILVVEDSGISEVSLVNNPLLFEVFANNADFSSNSLNQILLDLDAHPSYNPPGTFRIALRNQTNGQEITEAALEAYNSLIAKGWTIDVDPPTTDSNNNTQSITLTTNSNDEFWSPNIITNSGATLKWSVSGGGVEIDEIVDNAPVLNLLNNNSETTITITSDQGFIGFTEFDTNDQGITSINFSQATELEFLRLRYEQLTSISVAENTALKVLNLKGNDLLNGIIDVSNNPNLEILVVEDSGISEVSLVNNPLLFEVFANNADFSSNSLNQILLDLDAHPSYNPPGTFRIALRNQTNGQEITEAALEAYNSLIAKGWTIDVDPPTTDSNNNTQSITLTTNSNDEFWSPNIITNSGATLKWSVSGGGVEIDEIVDNAPVLNLLNNNSETTITITSDQGFIGFTEFDTNDQGITSINFSQATELEFLRLRYEQLTSISVAENTALKVLNLKGNDLLNGIIDVSNNPNLEILVVEDSGISEVSLVNNPLLFEVFANNADFSSNSLNQILLDLDAHPSYNPPGTFRIALRNQTNGQEITEAALEAYNSLIAKGWTIDVDPPTTDSNNNTQSITLTTNSNDEFWSPNIITNSGATLKWSVSGGGVEIDEIVDNAPVLNLLNNNSETTITITSDQGFIGFTEFDTNDQGITSINFSQATELEFLRLRYEQLTSISVAENTALKVLNLKGNDLLNGIIDVSNNPNLEILVVEDSGISEVSLVNNPLLFEVFANNADFSSNSLNQILLDLDAHPSYNPPGTFRIALRNQTNGQEITEAALEAYNSLIAKGWTIDVDPPVAPVASKTLESKVSIYPNPISSDSNEVSFKSEVDGTADAILYNSNGQIIGDLFHGEVEKEQYYRLEYDLNTLEQGLYFSVFKIGDEIIRKKILITK